GVSVRARPRALETTIMFKLTLPPPSRGLRPGRVIQRRYTTHRMRPLRQILSAESTLAGFLDRRQREVAVLQCIRDSLPPALAAQLGVADARPPELALVAATGAAAGLVRQRGPALVNLLQRAGWEFTGIQIRVQARPGWGESHKVVAKQLDTTSVTALRAAADALADPELARALRRLADHASQAASGAPPDA